MSALTMLTKTCSICHLTISRNRFPKKGAQCKPCLSRLAVVRNRTNVAKRRTTSDGREGIRATKRRYRARLAAKGLTTAGTPRKPPRERRRPASVRAERERKPWHGLPPKDQARIRYRCDPKYALYHRLKRWMHKHARSGVPSKVWSPVLGYTVAELQLHLERQFVRGMGWHNMGDWHIDHIVPVASFDFQSPDDDGFRAAMALTNLRPVWARVNLSKGARREFLV